MLDAPRRTATCDTCFFGVEQLCCLHVEDACCPTYRAAESDRAMCLRRRAAETLAERTAKQERLARRSA